MPHRLAVLMAARDAQATIRSAIDSLSFDRAPFDLYIVDDCSAVPLTEILGPQPPHVEIIRLDANVGPAAARNAGLFRILSRNYKYVAIMDADDLSHRDRLAKQSAFLDRNPEVAVVGAWTRCFDEKTGKTVFHVTPPTEPRAVLDSLFFNSSFIHSSCMIRVEALVEVGLYSTHYPTAEDYELARRIATRFQLANLPEYLLDYRISGNGICIKRRRRQLFDRLRIQIRYFRPREWSAWAGFLKTIVLFVLPLWVITPLKSAAWRSPARLTRLARAFNGQRTG